MEEKKSFEEWALVELMGRQRIVGRVTEQTIAGATMLRVDVPDAEGNTQLTRFYGGGAIYAISPVSRDLAIKLATNVDSAPVKPYDLPPQLPERSTTSHVGSDEHEYDRSY